MDDEEEEEDDEEVEVIIATPLLFSRLALSTTTHLVPVGTHIAHILGFGQMRQPVVMTTTQLVVTVATPW